MDAKSLYDALISEQQNQDDERAALEASMIKEDMETLGAIPRWVPHDKNPVDALTKAEGAHTHTHAHTEPLEKMLQSAHFTIRSEQQELMDTKEVKAEKGYVPRPRISMKATGSTLLACWSQVTAALTKTSKSET